MSQQTINVGAAPNDGTGTPLRTAFQYCNSNFSELYTATGPSGNNITVPGNASITGDLTVDTSTLKVDSANDRVGVGTASPTSILHVQKSQDAETTLVVNNTNSGTNVGARFDLQSNAANYLTLESYGQNASGTIFGINKAKLNVVFENALTANSSGLAIGTLSTNPLYLCTNNTLRATLDSSGNLGLGTAPQAWDGNFKAMELGYPNFIAGNAGAYRVDVGVNGYFSGAGYKYAATGVAASYYSQSSGAHRWYNAASGTAGNAITFTQAMTLDASGNLSIGATSVANQERLNLTSSRNVYVGRFFNSASSGGNYGFLINYSAAAPNNASNEFLACSDNAASRLFLYSNGGIANYQSNDSNLSDERTKTDIKPLASYWNKIKALEVVTFKYKDQTHSDNNIGLIAQQVEAVAPELVDVDGFGNTPADGVPFKTIYTTDLYHGAIKALQEAMTRIEALEAKLA